jgi:hypothetical protein
MRVAFRRILALLIDWACALGWIAITFAIGVPLYSAGIILPSDMRTENVVAAIVLVAPSFSSPRRLSRAAVTRLPESAPCTCGCGANQAPPVLAGQLLAMP